MAKALVAEAQGEWQTAAEEVWLEPVARFAVDRMMDEIRRDLAALAIKHDVFFSERSLFESGRVAETLDALTARGVIYEGVLDPPKGKTPEDWEPRPQTLFRATEFRDDLDRPLKKSDGSWTYFAADIAYHRDKVERGFNTMIDVWGADHGGYVKRMKAAVNGSERRRGGARHQALPARQRPQGRGPGQNVEARRRFLSTLREVVDAVGRDVVRFIMLTRRNDAPLDFDFAKVTEQSRDNPVFYVQYAHARGRSAMRRGAEALPGADLAAPALAAADLDRLTHADELALIKTLAHWPHVVESAAQAHEPHRLTYYLHDVASAFHALWNKGTNDTSLRFVVADDPALTEARLALVHGVITVIASGLGVMGVVPAEELR